MTMRRIIDDSLWGRNKYCNQIFNIISIAILSFFRQQNFAVKEEEEWKDRNGRWYPCMMNNRMRILWREKRFCLGLLFFHFSQVIDYTRHIASLKMLWKKEQVVIVFFRDSWVDLRVKMFPIQEKRDSVRFKLKLMDLNTNGILFHSFSSRDSLSHFSTIKPHFSVETHNLEWNTFEEEIVSVGKTIYTLHYIKLR